MLQVEQRKKEKQRERGTKRGGEGDEKAERWKGSQPRSKAVALHCQRARGCGESLKQPQKLAPIASPAERGLHLLHGRLLVVGAENEPRTESRRMGEHPHRRVKRIGQGSLQALHGGRRMGCLRGGEGGGGEVFQ